MKNKYLSLLFTAIGLFTISMLISKDDNKVYFYLSSSRIFTPGDAITLNISGNGIAGAKMNFKAYKIENPTEFFLNQKDPHSPQIEKLSQFKMVADWDYKMKSSRSKYYYSYDDITAPLKEKGSYIIEARYDNKQALAYVLISDVAMITKSDNKSITAFVVNRKTGSKISGFPLSMKSKDKKLVTLKTNSDGLALFDITKEDTQPFIIGNEKGDIVLTETYHYGNNNEQQIYLHTDRPVYRPEQTMYYRSIVRTLSNNGEYETPKEGDSVYIEIFDSRYSVVKRDTIKLSDFGTFKGEFTFSEEPPLGNYQITVRYKEGYSYFNFAVEEYKKPEYEVNVTLDKKEYTLGDKIKGVVNAKYYFGSPVTKADVNYTVFRSYYWKPWWKGSEWAYLYDGDDEGSMWRPYWGRNNEAISSGNGKLKDDGTFEFSFDTKVGNNGDYTYEVVANVVDASRRQISGSISVDVTRAEFYISSRTDKYVYKPKEDVKILVDIKKFDNDIPVASSFKAKVQRYWWSGKSYKENYETIWEGSGSTGSDGNGSVSFKAPVSGYYHVNIEATDSRGRKVDSYSYVYVADDNYSDRFYPTDQGIKIIPDKQLYQPGEMISALVIMPQAGADVLVTSEGYSVYNKQVIHVNSTTAIVRIPVEIGMAPNFFINVSCVTNDQMYNISQRVSVIPKNKIVKLQIVPDKKQYKPGESGYVTIRALNDKGEPAPMMDVALGIVDESIYAIRPDKTPDIQKAFYGNRYNRVQTNFSLNFYFYGNSKEAVQEAADMSATGSTNSRGRSAPAAMKSSMKDGFSDTERKEDDANKYVEPKVRSDFKDLMLWLPSVRTDAFGYAKIPVKFPDNLTTWRLTARAISLNSEVGQSVVKTIARKDLLVRMETPRFMIQGDQISVAVNIHNYLLTDKQVKVQFEGVNAKLDLKEKIVKITADGETRIDLKVIPIKSGIVKLSVKALTNEESDGIEIKVPVLPLGIKLTKSENVELSENNQTKTIISVIPNESDNTSREISIGLAPSLASTILGALDDLIGYPYGCVEQTMSRFLPTVIVGDVLKKINVPFDEKKREEMPKMVKQGTSRLYELQHQDGGWGWWSNDETDPFMTAYVIYGLTIAKNVGYPVDDNKYNLGVSELSKLLVKNNFKSDDWHKHDATTTAYMCYVASLVSNPDIKSIALKKAIEISGNKEINPYSKSLLAMALKNLGNLQAAQNIIRGLEQSANVENGKAFWKGKTWHYNWQDDEVETSASVVKSLIVLGGNKDLISKTINYLLTKRYGDSWYNTRQTAMVCYALADYVKESGELNPNFSVRIKVNGKLVATKTITKADVYKEHDKIKIDSSMIKVGNNEITIEKNGQGKLYVTALTTYYATGKAIQPSNNGFNITREFFKLKRIEEKGIISYVKEKFYGTLKSGEEILVKVKMNTNSDYEYVMVEDPIAAGCEVIKDNSLYKIKDENNYNGYQDDGYGGWRGKYWGWWYADRDIRDEKVSFFARSLTGKNEYEFSYLLRAQIPGSFNVMPSNAMLMYYPEVRGNSNMTKIEITP